MSLSTKHPDAFTALADPRRREILSVLAEAARAGDVWSLTDLANRLGMVRTTVSRHVEVLELCGVVRTDIEGRASRPAIVRDGFAVVEEWIYSLE